MMISVIGMIITLPIDGKNGIPNLNRAAGSKFDDLSPIGGIMARKYINLFDFKSELLICAINVALTFSFSRKVSLNGTAYLMQANTQKRRKLEEDDNSSASEHVEAVADIGQKVVETTDPKPGVDVNRRRQGRGRGHAASGRGRGSRVNGQAKTQTSPPINSPSNGQLINSHHKALAERRERMTFACDFMDGWSKEQIGSDDRSSLEEEITSLRAKVAALEEDFKKSRQEAADYQQLCHQLEKELKDLKDYDQQMKPKRMKIMSDLLISVSKAERQEARLKVRQDSLRLGSVGVIRAGTIISETWEDGQALKDLNSHLKHLLEIKEAVEWQRKSLKKRPTDKGDVIDAETGSQEDDILMQDEIYKSCLASIKREEETVMCERDRYELEKGRLIREMKRIRDEDGSYLPPECFELSKTPLVSSKVDVWSAGILLYQMLFGRRPFGHDQSQERILREDTIIKARKVEFPSRPAVSNEAKVYLPCVTVTLVDKKYLCGT
ncbi:unnamed protein product [Camellia sinensis]